MCRLREAELIQGYTAIINDEVLDIGVQVMVLIRLARHSREMVETFHQHVLRLPEVLAVYHLAGRQDFMVHIAVRDTQHLRDLAMDAFTTRPEVAHIETSLIYGFERRLTGSPTQTSLRLESPSDPPRPYRLSRTTHHTKKLTYGRRRALRQSGEHLAR